jgi:hypothetical protein
MAEYSPPIPAPAKNLKMARTQKFGEKVVRKLATR